MQNSSAQRKVVFVGSAENWRCKCTGSSMEIGKVNEPQSSEKTHCCSPFLKTYVKPTHRKFKQMKIRRKTMHRNSSRNRGKDQQCSIYVEKPDGQAEHIQYVVSRHVTIYKATSTGPWGTLENPAKKSADKVIPLILEDKHRWKRKRQSLLPILETPTMHRYCSPNAKRLSSFVYIECAQSEDSLHHNWTLPKSYAKVQQDSIKETNRPS